MRGGGETVGLAQIVQPPYAHCSVDLNKDGARARGKTQMDGILEGNDERHTT